jgi:DNA-nicking Smr family endonuclease
LSDDAAFAQAMAGVTRLECRRVAGERPAPAFDPQRLEPEEGLAHLRRLVESGAGFVVCATPEYIEGVGRNAPPGLAQRLHRGDFAVQAHLDLHGLTLEEARERFDAFLRASVTGGRSAVLIIHGRGLSSPGEPVLKTKVAQWLEGGRWSRWVLAFASARMCDGGSGATYVLLRRRPLGKRRRKKA